MKTIYTQTGNWTAYQKLFFRFLFCFFAVHQLLSPDLYLFLFGFNIKVLDWFDMLYHPLYEFINLNYLHLKQSDGRLHVNDFLFEILAIIVAIALSLLWGLFDRKRTSYNITNFWLQHFLKYSLSIILFSYGMDKLIPVQMPLPNTTALDMPLGYFRPGDVFWKLMGSQSIYQIFSGLAEVTGAILLLFSRTKVIGLLIIFGTLINILMLNIGFDIGVTYYIINLLIICAYLLFPYINSIVLFFIYQEKVRIFQLPSYSFDKVSKVIYKIPLILFIISAFYSIKNPMEKYLETSKVNLSTKFYDITTQIKNSDTIQKTLGDTLRWKYLTTYTKDNKELATISTMDNGKTHNYTYKNDTTNKTIYFLDNKGKVKYNFNYLKNDASGELKLFDNNQQLKLVLKEFTNEDWPLLKKRNKFLPFD